MFWNRMGSKLLPMRFQNIQNIFHRNVKKHANANAVIFNSDEYVTASNVFVRIEDHCISICMLFDVAVENAELNQ